MSRYNTDAQQQALAFFQAQAFRINSKVYAAQYSDWSFERLIYVNSEGGEWTPGVLTYMTDMTGRADWQSAFAKDIPLADVSQDFQTRTFGMAAIGYQYNLDELNSVIQVSGSLPTRRAAAARLAYQKFMFDLTLFGDEKKGLGGITNYPGVTIIPAPAVGTGSSRLWVNSAGVGIKTPAQIVADINLVLQGVARSTFDTILADTIMMPQEALDYIASTPYSPMSQETILSFVMRTNMYTLRTGQPLTIRSLRELGTAATSTTAPSSVGTGRLIGYKNSPEYFQLHLPMPHKFLPVYQDGPFNYLVPGIFRTGGVEVMSNVAIRYLDGISEPLVIPAP